MVRSSVASGGARLTIADALLQKQSYLWFIAVVRLVFFHMVRAGAQVHTRTKYITSAHVHSLYKQNTPLSRLNFFFGRSCEDTRLSI